MSYLSLLFAVFVMLLVGLYYILPKKLRWYALLAASLIFYGSFDLRYFSFLLFAALSTYFSAWALERFGRKKWILVCCVGANAAIWFAIKELPWLAETVGRFVSMPDLSSLTLLSAVGLSYFTLQAVGYLVDVWKG